jgi:hypothetical protein
MPAYAADNAGAGVFAEISQGQLVHIIRETPAGWARLEFPYLHNTSSEYVFGWAPVQVAGQAAFRQANLADCQPRADVASLAAMSPAEHLICFGAGALQLEGWATFEGFGPWLYTGQPGWLATPSGLLLMSVDPLLGGPAVPIHLDPQLGEDWPVGSHVTVTATFNHDASVTCRRSGPAGAEPETEAESTLWCQQQLVVEEFEITGR